MILNELYEKSPESYQDLENDNTQPQMGQLRKTRLTLRQIRKLRKMNDIRKIEINNKLKYVKAQYSPPAEPAGQAMPM
jgi:hypothetical protein